MYTKRMQMIIALMLLSLCGACFGAFEIGQPVSFDPTAVNGSTGHYQTNPAIAGSGTQFMAVWVDMRDAGRTSDLFAARISPTGTVLEPGNVRLTTHASVSGRPDICWNGESFFVVFAGNVGVAGDRLYSIRISADGTVLDSNPIMLSTYGNLTSPRVSWDGTNHVVVWSGDGFGTYCGVHAVRVSRTGAVVDTTPIAISAGTATWDGTASTDPAVASSSSGDTLVVWCKNPVAANTSNDLYGAILVGGAVTVGGIVASNAAGSQDKPDCCWAGDHFKVVWSDDNPAAPGIRSARISEAGAVLDPDGLTVSSTTDKQLDPRIAPCGDNWLVTWTRNSWQATGTPGGIDVYAGRVDAAGNALDGTGFAVCSADGRQTKPVVAAVGANNLMACWMDDREVAGKKITGFGWQVRAAGLTISDGVPAAGAEFRLAESASQHAASCSAFNGKLFLVCWEEWNDTGRTLYGELLDAYSGQPVTSAPFVIAPIITGSPLPDAAWNGETFVVTWLTDTRVMATRVSPTGSVLDPSGIVLADNGATRISVAPCIASDGNRCLIVYKLGYSSSPAGYALRAALLSRDGTILSDSLVLTTRSGSGGERNAVCWTGQCYLLAWRQPYYASVSGVQQVDGIDYTTVSATGVPATHHSITDATYPYRFKLACSGQNVLLVSQGTDMRTRRFSLAGALLDTTPLVLIQSSAGQDCLNLAWDGIDYVLGWIVPKVDTAGASSAQDDVQFTRVDTSNQLIGITAANVTNTLTSEIGAAMCAGPRGRVFFAFSSYEGAPYRSARIKGLYMDTLMYLTSLGPLSTMYEGAYVSIPNRVVSAGFPGDRFYVQYLRTFGIGVKSVGDWAAGSMVTFTGRLKKINGETLIDASTAQVLGTGNPIPRPLGLTIEDLGGIAPTPGYCTVTGASGPYNIGLRVKVWGKVTHSETGFFYLDDGSNVPTDPGRTGVKVYGTAAEGIYVEVTGISGSETSGDKIIRVIRSTDVQPVGGVPPPPPPF